MNEILVIWFIGLVLFTIYTYLLYEDTLIEKAKFIGVFMGAFTLVCWFMGM